MIDITKGEPAAAAYPAQGRLERSEEIGANRPRPGENMQLSRKAGHAPLLSAIVIRRYAPSFPR
ncbi:hypothetical protein [Brenneria sp. L3-3Z]|uniref:hypothetical protein n=1 Tax=Brenneria sp. L3-3Z TaxID=3094864 RepID=UPI0029C34D14|nr:hypothetical protein [Brenneria sp. L3-3Z]MDX5630142.1 hypothetical protein [Brenneria sp. L3-3Z]